jgi:hypothetical protein
MKKVEVKVTVKQNDKRYGNYSGEGVTKVDGVELLHAVRPENMQDVNALASGRATEKNGYKENPFNFVADAIQTYLEYADGLRTNLRNAILSKVEGPGKDIEKLAKTLLATGIAPDIEAARAAAINLRKQKGLPV